MPSSLLSLHYASGTHPCSLLRFLQSWMGHAEPASGMVSLLHTLGVLEGNADLHMLHLRGLNSYVETVLDSSLSAAGPVMQPMRQRGPGRVLEAGHALGISAFAFQVGGE